MRQGSAEIVVGRTGQTVMPFGCVYIPAMNTILCILSAGSKVSVLPVAPAVRVLLPASVGSTKRNEGGNVFR